MNLAGENDVKLYKGDGGVETDSIAQGDVLFTLGKAGSHPEPLARSRSRPTPWF